MELGHSVKSTVRTTATHSAANVVGVTSKRPNVFIASILRSPFIYDPVLHALRWGPRNIEPPPLIGTKDDPRVFDAVFPMEGTTREIVFLNKAVGIVYLLVNLSEIE